MTKSIFSGSVPQNIEYDQVRVGPIEPLPTGGDDAIQRDTAWRIDKLYRAASKPDADPPWMDLFTRISSQTHMAPLNLMLADIQRPGVRYVAFPNEWEKIGRKVKPAAIPIILLWPFGPVRCAYEVADTTGDEKINAAQLDQVFWKPLMSCTSVNRFPRRVLKEDQIEVKPNSLGYTPFDYERSNIKPPCWYVHVNPDLDKNTQFIMLVRGLAHVYLGHLGGNGKKWPCRSHERLDVRQFESESVVFIVTPVPP